jgi:hypothetical protein
VAPVVAEHSPSSLNLGELRIGERRTARLTVYVPANATVTAAIQGVNHPAGTFRVEGMRSYSPYVTYWGGSPSWVPGNAQLPTYAGHWVEVDVSFSSALTGAFWARVRVTGTPGWYVDVPVQGVVTVWGDRAVMPLPGERFFKVLPGKSIDVGLDVQSLSRLTEQVQFIAEELPPGVSMNQASMTLAPGQKGHIVLHFDVREDAQRGMNQPMAIVLEYAGRRTDLALHASIYEHFVTFKSRWRVTDSLTCEQEVEVHSNGEWRWRGALESNAYFLGDIYLMGFMFNFGDIDPATGDLASPGAYAQGTLGAYITGGEMNVEHERGGTSAWVRDNYFDAVDHGVLFHAATRDDASPLLLGPLKHVIPIGD